MIGNITCKVLNKRNGILVPGIYVGRPSVYGNPFTEGSREEKVLNFFDYFHSNTKLKEQAIKDLKGKNLYCWCTPLLCHAHVIFAYVNDIPFDEVLKMHSVIQDNGFSF